MGVNTILVAAIIERPVMAWVVIRSQEVLAGKAFVGGTTIDFE